MKWIVALSVSHMLTLRQAQRAEALAVSVLKSALIKGIEHSWLFSTNNKEEMAA